jgi:hypothetical protein
VWLPSGNIENGSRGIVSWRVKLNAGKEKLADFCLVGFKMEGSIADNRLISDERDGLYWVLRYRQAKSLIVDSPSPTENPVEPLSPLFARLWLVSAP